MDLLHELFWVADEVEAAETAHYDLEDVCFCDGIEMFCVDGLVDVDFGEGDAAAL